MAITSKYRLMSRDDIELRVVVKFRVGLKLSAVENIKTNSKHPLQIMLTIQNWKLTCLVSVSYHNLLYSPDLAPLDFRLLPDLTKEPNGLKPL